MSRPGQCLLIRATSPVVFERAGNSFLLSSTSLLSGIPRVAISLAV